MIRIELPWPDKGLSPNARGHWAGTAKKKRSYRSDCNYLTLGQVQSAIRECLKNRMGALPVRITFLPPDKRSRDRDNMIASFKSGQDGVAAALGVDDSRFEPTYAVGLPHKGGAVIFEVSANG